jgi:3-oxoadipate enol-lactonase
MPIAENGGLRLNYEISGPASGRVLLLSNSIGSSLHMWNKVLPRLETTHRVLRYDTRGHGQSGVPSGPYTLDQLGGDVLFLLDHLDIEHADICGLSLGGMIAMWLGIHAPQRVTRIILANTAARIGSPALWDQRIALVQTSGMAVLASMTMERWFTQSYRDRHPGEMERMRSMVATTSPEGYKACCGVLRDTDLRSGIPAITAPALIISGTHDPATPPSDGQALHAALRDSNYIELDASHLSAWERAEEFSNAVLKFLNPEERGHG